MIFVTRDVVVVTINRRLSAFGYLNLIDLGAPQEFSYAGVCGVMDMTASLEWVRDVIENFGGDPNCVMIFGQSGGGAKTSIMLGTPAAEGLFHRAAIQSGSALRLADPATAAQNAELLLDALGIDTDNIARIQRKSWQEILQAMSSLTVTAAGTPIGFSPVLDGKYLTHPPFDPTAPEESANLPVIISSTLHDAALALTNFDLDDAGLHTVIAARFSEDRADAIIAAQKAARPQDSNYLIQASAFTDASRGNATQLQAERKAALGKAPVWVYYRTGSAIWPTPNSVPFMGSTSRRRSTMRATRRCRLAAQPVRVSPASSRRRGQRSPKTAAIPTTPKSSRLAPSDASVRTSLVWNDEIHAIDDYRGDLIRMLA